MFNIKSARRAVGRRFVLGLAGGVLLAAACASGVSALATLLGSIVATSAAQDQPPDESEPNRSKKVVVIYVTQYGFEPADTEALSGDHILMIRNNTDDPDLEVVATGLGAVGGPPSALKPGDEESVTGPVRLPFNRRRVVTTPVRFARGDVRLIVPGRPDWACRIAVKR